jgi:hypothetical protein
VLGQAQMETGSGLHSPPANPDAHVCVTAEQHGYPPPLPPRAPIVLIAPASGPPGPAAHDLENRHCAALLMDFLVLTLYHEI